MTYFAAIRAVARVYRTIHTQYIHVGAGLLTELSALGSDEVLAARHASLVAYNERIGSELAAYIADVAYPTEP